MSVASATSEVQYPTSFRCTVCNELRSGEPAEMVLYGPVCRLCVDNVTREKQA